MSWQLDGGEDEQLEREREASGASRFSGARRGCKPSGHHNGDGNDVDGDDESKVEISARNISHLLSQFLNSFHLSSSSLSPCSSCLQRAQAVNSR